MIAYVMLYAVTVGVPLLVAATAVAAALRRHGRSERGVWLAALGLTFAVPALFLVGAAASYAGSDGVITDANTWIGVPTTIVAPAEWAPFDVDGLILITWLAVSCGMMLHWGFASYRLARAAKSWHRAMIDGVAAWVTDDLGPAVAGVLRPRVLAPTWMLAMPEGRRALILCHELEHIRARDPLLIACTRLARIAAPWNPIVWALSSRLVRAVELDCDRRVLARSRDVALYGETLLAVSARRPGRLLTAAAFAESEAPLRNRILAMTTPSRPVSIAAILSSVVLGVVLLVGMLQIPIPTVRIQLEVDPSSVPAPVEQAPPADGLPIPYTVRPSLINQTEVEQRLTEAYEQVLAESDHVGSRDRPRFTPMSVEPQLLNGPAVLSALREALPADFSGAASAVLRVRIDGNGVVQESELVQESGHAAFGEVLSDVTSIMRFSPALNRDQRVPVWVEIPFRIAPAVTVN